MLSYVFRRLLVAIPTLFIIVTVAFFMLRAAPGGPFTTQRKLPPEIMKNVEAKYGLDQPLIVQYGNYLWDAARGDFGPSLKYINRDAIEMIKEAAPTSIQVGLSSLIIALIIGITLGVWGAIRQNRPADYLASTVAMIGICVPTFVTGPLLMLFFATKLGWLPVAGITGGLKSFILPVTVLALPQIAAISRLTRGAMIEVLNSNYIRTARAKGLSEFRIVTRHALRAGLLPLISFMGPACAGIITGSLVVEKLFRLPGIGRMFYTAAMQRDYTIVMAVVILYAALIIVFNLIADILYAAMDPRVRLS